MDQTKPFAHLDNARGTIIRVELKNSTSYEGKLESFDMHLNLVLSDARLNDTDETSKVLIRGDMIVAIREL